MTSSKVNIDTMEELIFLHIFITYFKMLIFINEDSPTSIQDSEYKQGELIYQAF